MGNQERPKMTWSDSVETRNEDKSSGSQADLFDNNRRLSETPVHLRNSLGLPDNGRGLTQDYYNISETLSKDALVDLIVRRRSLKQESIDLEEVKNTPRRRTSIHPELEEKIMKTLAWKEMEDEINKEDVVVQVKKKERQMRKEARKVAPHQRQKPRSSQAEERRAFLRTSLLVTSERRNTSDSIKSAIEEFKNKNKVQLVEVPEAVIAEEVEVSKEIIENPRILLERIKETTGKHNFTEQEDILEYDASSKATSKTDISHISKKEMESVKSAGRGSVSSIISGGTDFSISSKKHDRSRSSRPGSSKKMSFSTSTYKKKRVNLSESNPLADSMVAGLSAKVKPGSATSSNGTPSVFTRPKRPTKARRRSTGNSKLVPGVAMGIRPQSRRSSVPRTARTTSPATTSKPSSRK